jgi:hypothetical protein
MDEINIEPTDRQTVRGDLEKVAKGKDVFRFGPGLGFVANFRTPFSTDGTELLYKHGWVIGGIYFNEDVPEIALFAFPLDTVIE